VGGCVQARLAALKRVVTEQQTKKSSGPGDGFDVRATGIFLFFFVFSFSNVFF
jgi:ribosome-interacting GTPase 1